MVKWLALVLATIALIYSADERKVRTQFERTEARLSAIENRTCLLMTVNTPTGVTSICSEVAR